MRRKRVAIFGSSRLLPGQKEYRTVYNLGKLLAQSGCDVCNGGYGGVMRASAHGAHDAGGKSIGVVAKVFGGVPNEYIDTIIRVDSFAERLLKLVSLGDAYIVLRGGTGTLVELSFVWELMNKKIEKEKPILLLGNFWARVINTLKNELVHEGMGDAVKLLKIARSPAECVNIIVKSL